jgi:hypothetical protein
MRVTDWHPRMIEVFEGAHGKRFRWGYHDCCQFAAKVRRAVTGADPRKTFPRYRTKEAAAALLETHGGMLGLLTHGLGEPVHASRACDGDIVLVDFERGQGPQPAVCRGVYSYAPGMRTLQKVETLKATAAWVL